MSNGKFAKRKGIATKTMFMILAVVLIVGISVGGTLAWLTDTTGPVTNTFTVGDIDINLAETTGSSYKFVPGDKLAKDPKVTVTGGSEDCYLFVRITEKNNAVPGSTTGEKVINWAVDSEWASVTGHEGYWYRVVTSAETAQTFAVLTDGIADDGKDGSVSVSTLVTKDMVDTLNKNRPQIVVTAAAVQKDNVTDVADAFSKLPTSFTT